jgi:hypothetical protein
LANTPEFAQAQRQRKKVEALFAELKHQIGLRRLRLRRLSSCGSSSAWPRWPRTSNDLCSSANRQDRFYQLPRSRTEKSKNQQGQTRRRKHVLLMYFFNTHSR